MNAVAFDTHAFVKKLQGVGFTQEQAEIITELQKQSGSSFLEQAKHDFLLDELATKRDLDARIKETEFKIELVRAELKKDIAEAKSDLTRWILAAGVLQTTLLAALMMKLAHLI